MFNVPRKDSRKTLWSAGVVLYVRTLRKPKCDPPKKSTVGILYGTSPICMVAGTNGLYYIYMYVREFAVNDLNKPLYSQISRTGASVIRGRFWKYYADVVNWYGSHRTSLLFHPGMVPRGDHPLFVLPVLTVKAARRGHPLCTEQKSALSVRMYICS